MRDGQHVSVRDNGVHVELIGDSAVLDAQITCGFRSGILIHGHDASAIPMTMVAVRQDKTDGLPADATLLQPLDRVLTELHSKSFLPCV